MPTILCRKIILTDHLESEHFGAFRLHPVDNPFDEHFGANCSTLLLTLGPSHRRFLWCLTTSVATRRCRCKHRSVFSCELSCLEGLLYVISGILAGGIPGSA